MPKVRSVSMAAILSVGLVATVPLAALAVSAPAPTRPSTSTSLIAGGFGNQTDPHISGGLVTYTSAGSSSEIRYHDVVTGVDAAVPNAGDRDSLSGISGSTVVFRRVHTTGSTAREIMAFDVMTPGVSPWPLAPDPTARRAFPAIGGTTVAWMEFVGVSSTQSEIVAYDLGTGSVTRLSDDGLGNRDPAVSRDGRVLSWAKCHPDHGTTCDLWQSTKAADGTWSTAAQATSGAGDEILPDTNGDEIVFASNSSGDWNIEWIQVRGTEHHELLMEGIQTNPNVEGSLVSFEHESAGSTNADLFVYDLSTGELYQVTDTPGVDETLNDIAVSPDGIVTVVSASPDGLSVGHNDIYRHTFRIDATGPSYAVCPLFDATKAHRVGSTVPIRLQLCDATGANRSSPAVTLTATGLVKKDNSATTALAEDSGNANPDSTFRYDAALAGYAYNLSTRGLSRGTWELHFQASGDPTRYAVTFDLR